MVPPKKHADIKIDIEAELEKRFLVVCDQKLWDEAEYGDISHESPSFDGVIDRVIDIAFKLYESVLRWLKEKLLTEKEAADEARVHIDTIRRWRQKGKIKPCTEQKPFMYRFNDVIALRR